MNEHRIPFEKAREIWREHFRQTAFIGSDVISRALAEHDARNPSRAWPNLLDLTWAVAGSTVLSAVLALFVSFYFPGGITKDAGSYIIEDLVSEVMLG